MSASFSRHIEEDARLIILKELAAQSNGRASDTILDYALEAFGHTRSRDWLRTQLNVLQELGAIEIEPVGTHVVAKITHRGVEHVLRRIKIEGVKQPSLGA